MHKNKAKNKYINLWIIDLSIGNDFKKSQGFYAHAYSCLYQFPAHVCVWREKFSFQTQSGHSESKCKQNYVWMYVHVFSNKRQHSVRLFSVHTKYACLNVHMYARCTYALHTYICICKYNGFRAILLENNW